MPKLPTTAPPASEDTGIDYTQSSQYSDKPIVPQNDVFVLNQLNIQQVNREKLSIQKWRDANKSAESRYYPNRSWLYDIYEDIMVDGHLSGIIQKRIDTVLNKKLLFKRDDKDDPAFETLMSGVAFRNVCRWILETQLWGISGIEFEPGSVFTPRFIPRKHINTKYQVITIEQNGIDGIDYTTARNIMITGEPEDLGILLKCAAYVIYKRNGLADWAQYIEIFGQPIRIMKYNTNDVQAKIELKKTLDASGGSLALMIPSTVDFDLKEGKGSNGDGNLQHKFHNMCNAEMSVIVVGNTETTTHDGKTGTGAKSQVHKEQQEEITRSDMFYLLSYLNSEQFRSILKMYGYNTDGGHFVNTQEISIEYLSERINIDMELVAMGVPIADDYFYDTYGVPKPANYDELKAKLDEINQSLADKLNEPAAPPPVGQNPPKKKPQPAAYRPVSKTRNLINAISYFFAQAR